MHIRLVTDVEYQAVSIRIKYGFDGDAQFHHASVPCQVSAGFGDTGNEELTNLVAKLAALTVIQVHKILMTVYSL